MKVIVETCHVDEVPDEGYCRNMSCGLCQYMMKVIVETCRVDEVPDEGYCRNMSCGHT